VVGWGGFGWGWCAWKGFKGGTGFGLGEAGGSRTVVIGVGGGVGREARGEGNGTAGSLGKRIGGGCIGPFRAGICSSTVSPIMTWIQYSQPEWLCRTATSSVLMPSTVSSSSSARSRQAEPCEIILCATRNACLAKSNWSSPLQRRRSSSVAISSHESAINAKSVLPARASVKSRTSAVRADGRWSLVSKSIPRIVFDGH